MAPDQQEGERVIMIVGYARISTKGQEDGHSLVAQQQEILDKYPSAEIIVETASAAGSREQFDKLLDKLQKNDMLVVTALDRFCRTVREGLEYVDNLTSRGISIHIMNMGILDDTVMGRLMITCLLAFAEFERATIKERTQRGREAARLNPSYKEGRPKKFAPEHMRHALELLDTHSYKTVSEMTGISKSTLVRAKNNK
jgi:Site-specific recombinases, DNA invertase Pin homologs